MQAIGPYGAYETVGSGTTVIGPYGMFQITGAAAARTKGGGPGTVGQMTRLAAAQLRAIRDDDDRLLELLEDQGFVIINNPD